MLNSNEPTWFDVNVLPKDFSEISAKINAEGFYCMEGAVKASF